MAVSRKYPKGGIIDLPMPINISNISIICQSCNKKTRVVISRTDKENVRNCQKCKESLDRKVEKSN